MANFCEYCGSAVKPGHLYCENCGAAVAAHQTQAQPKATQDNRPAQPIPPVQVIGDAGKNAVTRAWEDLMSDKSNIGRIAILALLSIIPIVNFFVTGYILKWAVGATRGHDKKLPEGYFTQFTLGFFVFVVALVWSLVVGLLGQVPLLGAIATLFLLPMMGLSMMRVGMFGSIGAGFEITKIWNLYRDKLGEVAFAFWIPMLVALVAVTACTFIASLLGGISLVTISAGHGFILGGIGVLGALISLVCLYATMLVAVAVDMVMERAMGYVIAESASDWVRDSLTANPTL